MAEASPAAVAGSRAGTLKPGGVRPLAAEALAALLEGGRGVGGGGLLLIDSRPFVDFNASHIADAVNVNASKLLRRRLQQDKVNIGDVLRRSAGTEVTPRAPGETGAALPAAHVALGALFCSWTSGRASGWWCTIRIVGTRPLCVPTPSPASCSSSWSAASRLCTCWREAMQRNAIAYVLNASSTCPKPDFIPDSRFLRVPVNDSFCDKILPWLDASLDFIEEAKASDACVLVHCLAGISRSATIAIAYVMKRMDMSLDEAYRFVKEKRPSISPNFNFLGQLLDFEKKISREARREGPPGRRPAEGPESPAPPEERPLARALCALRLEDTARPKRRFSLDFKTYGEAGPAGDGASASAPGKTCQFSPVEEVSEQSPDKEEARGPLPATCRARDAAGFPFGLSRCQRRPSGPALKGWHSDILPRPSLSPPGGGGYRSSSAAYGGGHGPETARRRGRPRAPDRGDSRRSWHEESNLEKTRSCHRWSENDLAKVAARDSFSASLELIRVS
ncbi:dual specificity protein phosphatase 16 isoform X3 [Phyllopteryx taeniolatus]|uniref:dual specificity protein phosphatase 16 isoform X3 n=1 Tax=Phyllopteryx taeniolatus TaxID=161469 RepID=UPI002AD45120|nr:dual specificity protein phosphatase 16 isoform X3 [Phyllopteryx taeniolatus]